MVLTLMVNHNVGVFLTKWYVVVVIHSIYMFS